MIVGGACRASTGEPSGHPEADGPRDPTPARTGAGAGAGTTAVAMLPPGTPVQRSAVGPLPMLGEERSQEQILETLAGDPISDARIRGEGDDAVLHLAFGPETEATFRPIRQGRAPEVAAYRLARLLHLDNVPPATTRSVTRAEIEPHLDEAERAQLDRMLAGDVTLGAVSFLPGAPALGLEEGPRLDRWTASLRMGGFMEREDYPRLADLGAMVVFDYLIGNATRFSANNVLSEGDDERLLLVGHQEAFPVPATTIPQQREILGQLSRVERFSRTFVQHLAGIDDAAFRRELAVDPSHARSPILFEPQIRELAVRHRTVVSYISSLIDEHGEDQVLAFP